MEILEYFKGLTGVNYNIRFQSEFNKQKYIYPIVSEIIKQKELPNGSSFCCVLGGRKNTHRVGRPLC